MPDYDIHGNDMNRDVHGNPMDSDIHGNRPMDVHGNPWEGRPLVGPPDASPPRQTASDSWAPTNTGIGRSSSTSRPSGWPLQHGGRGGSASADIVLELFRWRSLAVWAVVAAIFYFTPLWKKSTPTSIWTPVVFALPLAALAVTSPTARKYVAGFLLFLIVGIVLFIVVVSQMFPGSIVRHQPEAQPAPPSTQHKNGSGLPKHRAHKHRPPAQAQ